MEIINPIKTLNTNTDLVSTNSISSNDIVNTDKETQNDPYAISEYDDVRICKIFFGIHYFKLCLQFKIHSGSTEILPKKYVDERNAYLSDQSEVSFESHDDDRDKDYEYENTSQSESESSLFSVPEILEKEVRDLADNEVEDFTIEEVGNGNALDGSTSTKTIIKPKHSNKNEVIEEVIQVSINLFA